MNDAAIAWQVESLGRGVYLFRWLKGFYLSVFVVGRDGVTAIDPVSDEAAAAYRAAIAGVTDRPLRRIIYSHDHRDHICGGSVLAANSGCEICAHALAQRRIAQRGDADVLAPTRLLGDGEVLAEVRLAARGPLSRAEPLGFEPAVPCADRSGANACLGGWCGAWRCAVPQPA